MEMKDMGDAFAKFAHGEITASEVSKIAMAYLDSPDWRRRKAAQAAVDLKQWKAGRARLLEFIEKARIDGYLVETEFVPLKDGHDSILVRIEGGGTGFPSFLDPTTVEQAFADILAHAIERRTTPKVSQ
jgi:hypothetical protein